MNPARRYRQLSAQGTSPLGIVMQAYDQIVSALAGAVRAIEARDIERKTNELNHALTLISHLQAGLDFEAGGEVARAVDRFYAVERGQIMEASARLSTEMLQQVMADFVSQREAWEQVERAKSAPRRVSNSFSSDPSVANTAKPSAHWSA